MASLPPLLDQKSLFDTVIKPLLNKYPEINWFAHEKVFPTPEMPTAISTSTPSWTQQLAAIAFLSSSSKKYVELERMLHSVVCLHLLKLGTKEAHRYWVKAQNDRPLTWDSFQLLHQLLSTLINGNEDIYTALQASLVYSDLGKTPEAKERAIKQGITEADHDDFMEAVYNAPPATRKQIIPSFEFLKKSVQDHILALHLAVPLHWGHALHLEGGVLMFKKLLSSTHQTKLHYIEQAYLIQICDVAASAAHTNPNGAVAFNQVSFTGYQSVLATVKLLIANRKPAESLSKLIDDRRSWIGYPKDNTAKTRILCRIAAFVRFFTPEEGEALRLAADKVWSKTDWELMVSVFDIECGINAWNRNPTYINGALLNLLSHNPIKPLIDRCEWMLQGALDEARICQQYESLGHHLLDKPLCFQRFAEQARTSPEWFLRTGFHIEALDFNNPQMPVITFFFPMNITLLEALQQKLIEAFDGALNEKGSPSKTILNTLMSFCFHSKQLQKNTEDNAIINISPTHQK